MKLSFAMWEQRVRFYNEFLLIFTKLDETGKVIEAFTENGEIWRA